MKKEKGDLKSDRPEEDNSSSSTLIDPTLVSVIGLVNKQKKQKSHEEGKGKEEVFCPFQTCQVICLQQVRRFGPEMVRVFQ